MSQTIAGLTIASSCTPVTIGHSMFALPCAATLTNGSPRMLYVAAVAVNTSGGYTLAENYTLAPGQSADLPALSDPTMEWVVNVITSTRIEAMGLLSALGAGVVAGFAVVGAWNTTAAVYRAVHHRRRGY